MLPLILLGVGLLALTLGGDEPSGSSSSTPPGPGGKDPFTCPDLDKLDPQVRAAVESVIATGDATTLAQTAMVARQQGLNALADCLESLSRSRGPEKPGAVQPPPWVPNVPGIPGIDDVLGPWMPGGGEEPAGAPHSSFLEYCPEAASLPPEVLAQIDAAAATPGSGPQLQALAAQLQLLGFDEVATCLAALSQQESPVPGDY